MDGIWQISVKLPDSETVLLDVAPSTTVNDLRHAALSVLWRRQNITISALDDFQALDCMVLFEGSLMQGEHSLSKYNVTRDSTIHIRYRARGGMLAGTYSQVQRIEAEHKTFSGTVTFAGTPLKTGHVLSVMRDDNGKIIDELQRGHAECKIESNVNSTKKGNIRMICGVLGRRQSKSNTTMVHCHLHTFLIISHSHSQLKFLSFIFS